MFSESSGRDENTSDFVNGGYHGPISSARGVAIVLVPCYFETVTTSGEQSEINYKPRYAEEGDKISVLEILKEEVESAEEGLKKPAVRAMVVGNLRGVKGKVPLECVYLVKEKGDSTTSSLVLPASTESELDEYRSLRGSEVSWRAAKQHHKADRFLGASLANEGGFEINQEATSEFEIAFTGTDISGGNKTSESDYETEYESWTDDIKEEEKEKEQGIIENKEKDYSYESVSEEEEDKEV